MKILACICCLTFCFLGCSSNSTSTDSTNSNTAPSFSAKFNGTPWQPTGDQGSGVSGLVVTGIDMIKIDASRVKGSVIEDLSITLGKIGKGSFDLTTSFDNDNHATYYIGQKYYSTSGVVGGTGTVNVTKCDTTNHLVSGTFAIEAPNVDNNSEVLHITEGTFTDIKWYVQ